MPAPYDAVHDVMDVDETVRESVVPIVPLRQVPFCDEFEIIENAQPVMVVVVVEIVPPARLTIDAVTLALVEVEEDVTVSDVNTSDPFEI